MSKMLNIKINTKYKITGNTSGHGFQEGDVVKTTMKSGVKWYCTGISADVVGLNYYVLPSDLDAKASTRPEMITEAEAELVELDKKKEATIKEIERLKKFPSDEDEIAYLIVTASDSSKSEADRCAAIAAVLKARVATDLI